MLNNIGDQVRGFSHHQKPSVIDNLKSQEIIGCPPGDVGLSSSWSRLELHSFIVITITIYYTYLITKIYEHDSLDVFQANFLYCNCIPKSESTSQGIAYLNKCVAFAIIYLEDGCHISTTITVIRSTKDCYHFLVLKNDHSNPCIS